MLTGSTGSKKKKIFFDRAPLSKHFCGLFIRWMGEINPKDLGNAPSDVPGWTHT